MYLRSFASMFHDKTLTSRTLSPSPGDRLPQGAYNYQELYSNLPDDDHRRVVIAFLTEEGTRDLAYIHLGLDQGREDSGPFLHPIFPQSEYAPDLLRLFVAELNRQPPLFEEFHEHYHQVRAQIEGRAETALHLPGRRTKFKPQAVPEDWRRLPVLARDAELLTDIEPLWVGDGLEWAPKGPDPAPLPDGRENRARIDETNLVAIRFLISEIGQGLAEHRLPLFSDSVSAFLERQTQWAFPLLDLLCELYVPRPAGPPEIPYRSCLILFRELLFKLKYSIDRGYRHSQNLVTELQREIAVKIFVPEIGQMLQQDILDVLRDAGIELSVEIKSANLELNQYYERFQGNADIPDLASILLEMEQAGMSDAFDMLDFFLPQLELIPSEGQQTILVYLASVDHPMICEILSLMLLHPDPLIRHRIPELLLAGNYSEKMSPVVLRRLILKRNWLPLEEKPAVDLLIKRARRARVECAQFKGAGIHRIFATTIDGSGLQGIWLEICQGETFMIGHILLKQDFGIADVWCRRMGSLEETNEELQETTSRMLLYPVSERYLDQVLSHHIALGLTQGRVPPPGLLQIAEVIGSSRWDCELVDETSVLAEFLKSLGDRINQPEYVQKSVRDSIIWAMKTSITDTWFEDEESVDLLLVAELGHPASWGTQESKALSLVLAHILEPRRGSWFRRLFWTAFWLRNTTPRPKLLWEKFLLVAREIHFGRNLRDIPMMNMIAAKTIQAAYQRSEYKPSLADIRN